MKHIKLFERLENDIPWKLSDFKKITKLKKDITEKEDYLKVLLGDYLILNPQIVNQNSLNPDLLEVTDWELLYNSRCMIRVDYDDGEEDSSVDLTPEQVKDFLEFMKDPDFHKDRKKYNI